jgi:Macrocin-O-methyltransferase (TylF)
VIARSGYPMDKVVFVKGPMEDTIPATVPDRISLLRLDTHWYSSTKQEIEHLYPPSLYARRLASGRLRTLPRSTAGDRRVFRSS